mgnify:CR=1 FL=1
MSDANNRLIEVLERCANKLAEYGEIGHVTLARNAIERARAGADHVADANRMVSGDVVSMGDLRDEDGDLHTKSMLVQFDTVEEFHQARQSGQCRFTVFGGDHG